jgi:ABC-type sugar transport system permease subunit
MILPIAQFLVFDVGVNFNSILLAFKEYHLNLQTDKFEYIFVGFGQFKNVILKLTSDPKLKAAVPNSIVLYLIGLGISSPLSLFFSYYIYKKKFASTFFRIALFLPSIISPIVLGVMFNNFAEEAIPAYVFKWFNVACPNLISNAGTRFSTLVFYNIWVGFGTSTLLYSSSMSSIDSEITEAAQLDGCFGIKEFIFIVFPLIYGTWSTFFYTGLVGIFTNQLHLHAFFGNGAPTPVYTIGYYMYVQTQSGTLETYPYLAAMGLMMTALVTPFVFLVKWLLRKIGPSVEG